MWNDERRIESGDEDYFSFMNLTFSHITISSKDAKEWEYQLFVNDRCMFRGLENGENLAKTKATIQLHKLLSDELKLLVASSFR